MKPIFTDNKYEAYKYYHATIDPLKIPDNLRIDFHFDASPTNLSKGSYISSEDTSDDSFCFYLHYFPGGIIPLESIIITNILHSILYTRKVSKKSVLKKTIDWFTSDPNVIVVNFFDSLFWQIFYKVVKYNKKCKTKFAIYNTTFCNHINKLKNHYAKYGYNHNNISVDYADFIPIYSAKNVKNKGKYAKYIYDLNYTLQDQDITISDLMKFMNTDSEFLHIFKDV